MDIRFKYLRTNIIFFFNYYKSPQSRDIFIILKQSLNWLFRYNWNLKGINTVRNHVYITQPSSTLTLHTNNGRYKKMMSSLSHVPYWIKRRTNYLLRSAVRIPSIVRTTVVGRLGDKHVVVAVVVEWPTAVTKLYCGILLRIYVRGVYIHHVASGLPPPFT